MKCRINEKKQKSDLKRLVAIINFIVAIIIYGKIVYSLEGISYDSFKIQIGYKILIDVESSKLYLFENGTLLKTYSCGGGKDTTPSPIGTWKIISKEEWGEGFGGNWLGLNVPWGQFGIHGTRIEYSVGWASSHGCIRMKNKDVSELYKIIPIGTEVVIVDGCYGVFGKGFRNLKSGMYGADVLEVQKKLKELGFFNETPNGTFGIKTEEAVKEYCKTNGISVQSVVTEDLLEHMGFFLMD